MGLLINLSLDHQFRTKLKKEIKKNLMKSYSGEIALPGQTDVQ